MKKLASVLSLILMLTLSIPIEEAAADRPSGPGGSHRPEGSFRGSPGPGSPSHGFHNPRGSSGPGVSAGGSHRPGGSSRGSHRPGDSFRGSPGAGSPSPGFHDRRGSSGHRGSFGSRAPFPGRHGDRGHFRGHPGLRGFLPGLIVGGFLGWGLAPRYYDYPSPNYYSPPFDYYPPPDYYSPPSDYYPPPDYSYPPPGEAPQSAPAEGQLFIYPRQGQSQEQQADDHYQCHNSAVGRTGFDPTFPPPAGTPEAETVQKSADYLRALEACLDARGYTLR